MSQTMYSYGRGTRSSRVVQDAYYVSPLCLQDHWFESHSREALSKDGRISYAGDTPEVLIRERTKTVKLTCT
jgi:hypothetical protein